MTKLSKEDTTAVLLHIPNDVYKKYLSILKEKGFSRQPYSAKLFIQAIEKEIKDNK